MVETVARYSEPPKGMETKPLDAVMSGGLFDMSMNLLEKTVLENPYIPHPPSPKQAIFLTMPAKEIMFGGAAGGGKSDALLMAALQYVHVPGYNAIIFRRTYSDLALPEAIMSRSFEWLAGTDAHWNEKTKSWTFPSGATLTFGYLEHDNQRYRYQGSAYQFIGFDELTQFTESQYRYLFSRLRRLKGGKVPLRMRAATNPGGIGHEWVLSRFLPRIASGDGGKEEGNRIQVTNEGRRFFIPSKLHENPGLDAESYREQLAELDEVERAQLEDGDWGVRPVGDMFRRDWFGKVSDWPRFATVVRFWDMASTDPDKAQGGKKKKKPDADWTVGVKLAEYEGLWYILDIVRFRKDPKDTEDEIKRVAKEDGYGVSIYMEQEGGSSGKIVIDHYARNVLKGYTFDGEKPLTEKAVRAKPVSSAAKKGLVFLMRAEWNKTFFDEAEVFPQKGFHDDQIDALSGAFAAIRDREGRQLVSF